MISRPSIPILTLAVLALQGAFANPAHAASGAVFYDNQTVKNAGDDQQVTVEGMAWGYFHTGTLTQTLTISAGDPVAIQLYDKDTNESYVRGADDELQFWMSDTDLTATAGQSVRFEFFSVVPSDLRKAASELNERELEIYARLADAPGTFATLWSSASWTSTGRTMNDRDASFTGYPAADHVVRMYYVKQGEGFSGETPGNRQIPAVVEAGDKTIWASAAVGKTLIDSATTENIWRNAGVGGGKGMTGTVVVMNPSDRDGLLVNLDFLELYDEDDSSDDDLLVEVGSRAPADFNLGPGGTLKWVVHAEPTWEAVLDARDLIGPDLDPYAVFSVNGDPDLPLDIVDDSELAALEADQPDTTFSFGATDNDTELPAPPDVDFDGEAASYTVDQDVDILCIVTDNGGGIAYDTCADIYSPAWSFPAGTSSYTASAFDLYGQEGSDSVSFEVGVTYDSLIVITQRFVDHAGTENSLVQKIENAKKKTGSAQDAACDAFINEVQAQSGKNVSEFYAEVLIYWAEQLKLQ